MEAEPNQQTASGKSVVQLFTFRETPINQVQVLTCSRDRRESRVLLLRALQLAKAPFFPARLTEFPTLETPHL